MSNTPTEYDEQCVFVEWLEWNKIKFTATAHSTYTKSWKQKSKNTKSGLRRGFPDMVVVLKNKLLFIEMKRKKPKGKLSVEQEEWLACLGQIENIESIVCYGADEAIEFVKKFL